MNEYTGRKVAILTDVHSLLEPLNAIIEDVRKKGITEVYSLGDNIGTGPNPSEVLNTIESNGIITINGNSEDYVILGIAPFGYVRGAKKDSYLWTKEQLTERQVETLRKKFHSYDLKIGGKLVGLCHFANDVRCDYSINSTWLYQSKIRSQHPNPQEQFYYTNSLQQQKELQEMFARAGDNPRYNGVKSTLQEPLFGGRTVDVFDEIFQGHVHFKFLTEDENVKVRTIRAAGMAYGDNEPADCASYVILHEKQNGYDVEEVLVPYDREKMLSQIERSSMPSKDEIRLFTSKRS